VKRANNSNQCLDSSGADLVTILLARSDVFFFENYLKHNEKHREQKRTIKEQRNTRRFH
jgi:hypothetical protein